MAYSSGWTIITLRVADKEMRKQPVAIRAEFTRLFAVIREDGFAEIPSKKIKKLRKEVWELRVWGRDTTTRALYLKRVGRRVIIARVFTKKKPKTDDYEIELALKRVKEYDRAQ